MKTFVLRDNRVRRGLLFGLSGGLFLFFVLSYFLLPSFQGLAWNGYYTVLLDKNIDLDRATATFEEAGLSGVLSAASATVEFSDFDKTEVVSLRALPNRLLTEDPRYDPFLKRAPLLFESASGREHVFYVPAKTSPLFLSLKLEKLFPGEAWSLVDWQMGRRLVFSGFFLLFVGLMVYRSRGMRLLAFAFALPWLNFFIHGSPAGFTAACLLYLGTILFLEAAWTVFQHVLHYDALHELGGLKDRAAYLGILAAAAAFLVLYPDADPGALLPLVFGAGGGVALFGLIAAFSTHRRDRREHRLFIPVSILPRRLRGLRGPTDRYRRAALGAAFALLVLAPLAARLAGDSGSAVIPRPASSSASGGFSREALKDLWALHGGNRLPDFSDYLCHRALQDGFLYGAVWGFPAADAKLSLSHYVEAGERIGKSSETVVHYDEAWYKEVLKSSKRTGLGDLLVRQGSRDVVMEPAGRLSLDASYLLRHAAVVIFAFLPLLVAGFGFASGFSTDERGSGLRRKQQEA